MLMGGFRPVIYSQIVLCSVQQASLLSSGRQAVAPNTGAIMGVHITPASNPVFLNRSKF